MLTASAMVRLCFAALLVAGIWAGFAWATGAVGG